MNPELLKRLDPIARRFGGYTAYTLSEKERVGTIKTNAVSALREIGYEWPPRFAGIRLEAAKMHPETGEVHQASFRKVDPNNERKQYHVHLWDVFSIAPTPVYVHREYRPDFKRVADESYSEMYDRLRTHYRPEYGVDYERGVMCDDLEALVS